MAARLVVNADLGNFNASWGAGRHVARSADGTWFYGVQDGVNGRVLWQSFGGLKEISLEPQPTMRPTLYADHSGLYCCAGMDGNKKNLMIWFIDDYKTVFVNGGTDPRVDALISQIATLNQEVSQLETALANIGQGGNADLSLEDRQALDWLSALRALFRL